MRTARARSRSRHLRVLFLSLAVVLFGVWFGARKVGAQPRPKPAPYEEPIDYAVAGPHGGVPLHPEGPFRSPFAHPHWGPAANTRVGILMSNVRDYDIQKGSFEADFFLTYTSDRPMPPMDPIFTNGKMDLKEVMADLPTFKMYRFIG
ncbi:MAG: hypothetical protein ABIP39_02565, partial [Polyangiaceae bacterium]